MKQHKFEHVDIVAALEAAMKSNTIYYQSDFEIDKKIFQRSAESDKARDKALLWMSRPSGTHCLKEAEVFLAGTSAFNTWKFHAEQTKDPILAYAVKITGVEDGKIMGNLYELDYPEHSLHVKQTALQTETADVAFKDGSTVQCNWEDYYHGRADIDYKQVASVTFQPKNPQMLSFLLEQEAQLHETMPKGDLNKHMAGLRKKSVMEQLSMKKKSIVPQKVASKKTTQRAVEL
ncbi:MAG: hypothetical protein EOM40_16810 [Clostridia bacterium]|nr:hypothetical protein [Clostridia bacterium]